jgi:TupA-like ATPgrasp
MSTPEELGRQTQSYQSRVWSALRKRSAAQVTDGAPQGPSRIRFLKKGASAIRYGVLHGVKYFLPDSVFLFLSHRRRVGRFPHLRHAATFNEIILDRCLHPDPLWSVLADKLAVREHVKARVGEQHLIPLLCAPEIFTQEVFDSLPDSFVMKANHGCGFVKVVWNKGDVSFGDLRQLADEWLSTDFYLASRERHYRSIKPRIYFEKLLLDRSGKVPCDYKINIFEREQGDPVVYTGVVSDRFGSPRHDFYDTQWNRLDIAAGGYPCSEDPAPRLPNWEEVVRVAKQLADGLGYVRVDLYAYDNEIFFGELTFTPGAGVTRFSRDSFDYEWGQLIRTMPSPETLRGSSSRQSCEA